MNAADPVSAPTPTQPDQVFDWLDAESARRSEAGLTRRLAARAPGGDELDLGSDDYLRLARDKRVAGAAAAAALKWGAGATGSRHGTGSTELHAELEHALARFVGAQAALVFSTEFLANVGAVTALSGAESAIVTDRTVHASLADGCRLSRADVAAVAHCDPAAVTHALGTRRKDRALVVTNSVFPVDGDLAPLPSLVETCRAGGAALLVDDSHGFGVLGEGGRGAAHEAGLAGEPDVVVTVSLSAALGAQGGAVLGPRRVIRHLVDTARAFGFDTALAPGSAAAALAALGALRDEPQLAERVRTAAAGLAHGLRAAGLPASGGDAGIVTVPVREPADATAWANACAERGVRVDCVRPPASSDGCRLRLSANAALTESDLDRAVTVVAELAPSSVRAGR